MSTARSEPSTPSATLSVPPRPRAVVKTRAGLDRPLSPTERSTPRRHRERGRRDRAELYGVLDEALICHLGVVLDGAPVVLPTCFGYLTDVLYLHGSSGTASLRGALGTPVCVTVTLLDGLVYARSVFTHSANYRSAVVHGAARAVTERTEKLDGLRAIVEHTTPGSWRHARKPTAKELAATAVLAVDLAEASVKVRIGPPNDEPADVARGAAWAGVLPVRAVFGEPSRCPELPPGIETPPHVRARAHADVARVPRPPPATARPSRATRSKARGSGAANRRVGS